MVTRLGYWKAVLKALDKPITIHTERAGLTIMQAEFGPTPPEGQARFNPCAGTLEMPGSTIFNVLGRKSNGEPWGVRHYPDLATGVLAVVKTLRDTEEAGYEAVLHRLEVNATAENIVKAWGASKWGTNLELMLDVLPNVRDDFRLYADKPINQ